MLNVRRGFTLIELLIALFVFSLLSAFSYRAINQLVNSRHILSGELEALFSVQKTFLFLGRGVQQSLVDDVKVTNVESLPTTGNLTSLSLQTAVERTDYVLRDDVLYLEHRVLPISEDTEYPVDSLALLSGVQSLSVSSIHKGAINNNSQYIGVEVSIQTSIFKQVSRVNFVGLGGLGSVGVSTLKLPSGADGDNSTEVGGDNSTEVGGDNSTEVGGDNSTEVGGDNSTVTDIPANY